MNANAWHSLGDLQHVPHPEELALPRAKGLAYAVARHADFKLIECLRHQSGDLTGDEVLIVDVACEGVPHYNAAGIRYPERLALHVHTDPQSLVEVLALRMDFPRLLHQNHTGENAPASLCLYYEPRRAVNRTWTPQSFLQRILLWLAGSANGTLHPADQPAEQVFFVPLHELVLPWNFDDVREDPNTRFWLAPRKRQDGRYTYLALVDRPQTVDPQHDTVAVIVNCPTVVHGSPILPPQTLGKLVDALQARGVNLAPLIAKSYQTLVPTHGVSSGSEPEYTILIVNLPIAREPGLAPERIERRGYFIGMGPWKLGVLFGGLHCFQGQYYRENQALTGGDLPPESRAKWEHVDLGPVDVLMGLSRETARAQSGLTDSGPRGVVVGAGAIGATLLDLWTRSGWGTWSAIDHDHIKPHNLARHPANFDDVGRSKAAVVARRSDDVTWGASRVTGIFGDAYELKDQALQALQSAQLVIDASTTLEYPRRASQRDDLDRHASVFMTPRGNASVILLEDRQRTIRARTLEAQYYRAVIKQAWGVDHLAGNLGTYYSGASCRDISMVLPYSRVMAHTAMLAEQIQRLSAADEARIRVWNRDEVEGAVTAQDVPVRGERCIHLEDWKVYIDEGLIDDLKEMRKVALPNETGGALMGYYDWHERMIVLVQGMPAPADSKSAPQFFERGTQGLSEAVEDAARRTANVVRYVGEWHSHPPGVPAQPSGDDIWQIAYLALILAEEGLPALSVIVGEDGDITVMKCESGL